MQSFTKSIFDLFNATRRYHVPLFQRQYVWSQEKQWEPLWEDIRAKAEEHLSDQEVDPHFLGAIVLSQTPTYGDQIPAHDVIDGQQRLTTFQLLLAAFRDFANAHGEPERANEVAKHTINNGIMDGEDEKFKVWPTNADREQFQCVMLAGSRQEIENLHPANYVRKKLQSRPRMVEAYIYFYDAFSEYIVDRKEGPGTLIRAVYQAMRKSLQLVSIELEGKDDPQVIFETLNARGEPLLPSDLLRNFIFLRASRAGQSAHDLYQTYWLPFDNKPAEDDSTSEGFWKKPERQGRLARPRLDLFIQHFLALKTKRDVNAGKLYQEYRAWIKSASPFGSVEDELKELTRYARTFEQFYVPDTSTRVGLFAARLRAVDTSTVYPLLLFLVADSGAPKEINGIVQDLESFLIRRMVCGLNAKSYNLLFLQILRAVTELATITREGFRGLLLAQTGTAGAWPDDDDFRRAWLHQPIYKMVKPASRLTMVLRAIEDSMVDAKREAIVIKGHLTVEHVMPQSWDANWPLPTGTSDVDHSTAERDRVLQSFGNLTLITQELNSAVSNAAFTKRRPELTEHSALKLNAYFQTIADWDEAAIKKRGEHLFEAAVKLWPHPGVVVSSTVPHAGAEAAAAFS